MDIIDALRSGYAGSLYDPFDPYRSQFDGFVPGGGVGGLPGGFSVEDAIRFRIPGFGGTFPSFAGASNATSSLVDQIPGFIGGGGGDPLAGFGSQFGDVSGDFRARAPQVQGLIDQASGFIAGLGNPNSPQNVVNRYRPQFQQFLDGGSPNYPAGSGPGVPTAPTAPAAPAPPPGATGGSPGPGPVRPGLRPRPGVRGE